MHVVLGSRIGAWLSRRLDQRPAPLPGPLAALRDHFTAEGISIDADVLQGASWGEGRHRAGFRIEATGRWLYVVWCDSPETARYLAERLTTSRSACLPMANATLAAVFTRWTVDDPMTRRVRDAFASFRVSALER